LIGNSRTSHQLHPLIYVSQFLFLFNPLITFLFFIFLALPINILNHLQAPPDYIAPHHQLIECVMQLFDPPCGLIHKLLLLFSLLMNLFHDHSLTL
jgi:hypothetical protein